LYIHTTLGILLGVSTVHTPPWVYLWVRKECIYTPWVYLWVRKEYYTPPWVYLWVRKSVLYTPLGIPLGEVNVSNALSYPPG